MKVEYIRTTHFSGIILRTITDANRGLYYCHNNTMYRAGNLVVYSKTTLIHRALVS